MTQYLTLELLLEVAQRACGPHVQVRDYGLLASALARPAATVFGPDSYPTAHGKAAALLHSLTSSHALADGNKRLAWAAVAAHQLVLQVEAARRTDLRAALQLGLAADRIHPDGETHSSLFNTLAAGPYTGTLIGHKGSVNSVAFTPDGRTLATGSWDKTAILWDLSDPDQPQRLGPPLTDHSGEVLSVAFAPDGYTLVTSGADGTANLWDTTDPVHLRQLGQPLTGHMVTSVAFAPDGHTLAMGGGDKTVTLWDLTDRARPRQIGPILTGHTGPVWSVAFAPNGDTLATGSSDSTVILWDLTNLAHPRQLGRPLTGHTGLVKSVAFSPDGHILTTSSFDGTTILWKVTDPAQPRPLGPPLISTINVGATNNRHGVTSIVFSPDGRTLTVGSCDVILWDLTNPTQAHRLGPPLGNSVGANAVAFALDGHTLAAGSIDGTVTRWDLTDLNRVRDHVVERACAATHGGLDRTEWTRYISDLPYQATCPV